MKLNSRKVNDVSSADTVTQIPYFCALSSAVLFCFSACTNPGSVSQSDYGPFDANGNYVEEWADNPKYSRSRGAPPPSDVESGMIAAHETPLPTVTSVPTPPSSARTSLPRSSATQSKPKVTAKPTVAANKPRPTTTKVTAKPKVAAAKPKPKVKPTSRVVVKKGDTLYELALRNKTSVSAIQKANGLRGTVLQIGQSLTIPK